MLKPSNVVAMFDGASTRTFDMQINELSTSMFIVRAYFFDIIEDIMLNSFYYKGEKYIFFTASAGQIRTKKTVFVKESLWEKHKNELMCGLTIKDINEHGGINVNKFLAYLALCNGATEIIPEFDIRKTVVVDDFESIVTGTVDYIDSKTYKIERRVMGIPITHTDGCGMMLPRVSSKNFMIRLPWVKGLLSPFAFDEFCREHGHNGDIVDIYGRTYNIFVDNIEVILTKSQFKMHKYFSSWQDYVGKFLANKCQANKCNEEEDYFRNAKFNYQMLQTLSDMSDVELKIITQKARQNIINIATDKRTMLKAFGAAKCNSNKTYLQQALEIYPEMLSDNYCREILKLIKRKLVRNARHGRFEVEGKYTFIIPDLYAFCERLFLREDNPSGLLVDGEVYCDLYSDSKELDCLRSPHLYAEHAVRNNVYDQAKSKWFATHGLYISCHDLISKVLQCDFDGDRSLVCADKTIVEAAKRNMKGVVPLYYEMGTASPVILDNRHLYEGLVFAFANCNIGAASNEITKVWNSENINLDVIKLLTAEVNFLIDAAKTLTKLERPQEADKLIRQYTKFKTPHFFVYAKDKRKDQVEPTNNSVVNRLEKIIPNKRIVFNKGIFEDFNYKMLMKDTNVEIDSNIIDAYLELRLSNRFNIGDEIKHNEILYTYKQNRELLLDMCSDIDLLVDMLVKYLYGVKNSKQKEALWDMFGDILLDNLKFNLWAKYGDSTYICEKCGDRFNRTTNNQIYCVKCSGYVKQTVKIISCIDCGVEFTVDARNMTKKRCDNCYKNHRREAVRANVQKHRIHKM